MFAGIIHKTWTNLLIPCHKHVNNYTAELQIKILIIKLGPTPGLFLIIYPFV